MGPACWASRAHSHEVAESPGPSPCSQHRPLTLGTVREEVTVFLFGRVSCLSKEAIDSKDKASFLIL